MSGDNGGYPDEMSREDEVQIKARAILRQIGPQILMAIGARDYVVTDGLATDDDGSDSFEIRLTMKVLDRQKALQITLDLRDTYTVTFLHLPSTRAKESRPRIIKEREDVYCDQLAKICYWITHDEKIRKGK